MYSKLWFDMNNSPSSGGERNDVLLKVVAVGSPGVGKTSLINGLCGIPFEVHTHTTIGVEFRMKDVQVSAGPAVSMQLWDTAGQERYHALNSVYYRRSMGALLVFDVTNRESFDKLNHWLGEIRKHADPAICVVICGNKTDLATARSVSSDEGHAFAASVGAVYCETSAKTDNVEDAFRLMADNVLYKISLARLTSRQGTANPVLLGQGRKLSLTAHKASGRTDEPETAGCRCQ